jgi:hypothetical protein
MGIFLFSELTEFFGVGESVAYKKLIILPFPESLN